MKERRNKNSSYQLCVSKNREDSENVGKMIKYLLEMPDDRVTSLMYQPIRRDNYSSSLVQGDYNKASCKSILSYIEMAESIVRIYKEKYGYFRNMAKHKIQKNDDVCDFERIRSVSASDIQWLGRNTEVLCQIEQKQGIEIYNSYYIPSKMHTTTNVMDMDVYENRVIVGFLSTVLIDIKKLEEAIQQGITEEEKLLKCMQRVVGREYTAPVITVKHVHVNYMNGLLRRIKQLRIETVKVFREYSTVVPCKHHRLTKTPRLTKTFQEIMPYYVIYKKILEWFKYGEMNIDKNGALFQVKTIDKLYEYYCLALIISALLELGYQVNETPSYSFAYSGNEAYGMFRNEKDVANTYVFHKEHQQIRLYYQPVIFSYKFENNISLYRTTGEKDIYTPDFCLQIKEGAHPSRYAIFDSKYTTLYSARKYDVKEILHKYYTNVADEYAHDAICAVWILRGRMDNQDNRTTNYHDSPLAVQYKQNIRMQAGNYNRCPRKYGKSYQKSIESYSQNINRTVV